MHEHCAEDLSTKSRAVYIETVRMLKQYSHEKLF